MRIVEIAALDNGAHRNQTSSGEIALPSGWAVIPDELSCKNFPFGTIEAAEIDGVMTATGWTPGRAPEPEPEPEPEPTVEDVSLELLADHEERICLLELTI